jgi:hypothetical protein
MDRIVDVLGFLASASPWIAIIVAAAAAVIVWRSLWTIGPTEVGLGLGGLVPLAMRFLQSRENLPAAAQEERAPVGGNGNDRVVR